MIIYLSGGIRPELLGRTDVGVMLTPNMGNKPDLAATPWGVDTGCYSPSGSGTFSLPRYLAYLERMQPYRATCLFATAPDVVGDARQTWGRSRDVLPLIRAAGYPAALVAQDGIGRGYLEWDAFDVLFIGGSDPWRRGQVCAWLCEEAKRRGKWLHVGRVNSLRRLRVAEALGADSADGTFVAHGPDVNLPRLEGWLRTMQEQPQLWGASAQEATA